MKGAVSAALREETSMTTVGDWWATGKRRVGQLAKEWLGGTTTPAEVAAPAEEPADAAPDCTNLSKLIRIVCAERQTSSVWWVVVTDSSADVYPLPGLTRAAEK